MAKEKISVEDFLATLKKDNPDQYDTVMSVRTLVQKIYPKVQERIMYGGIMFSLEEDFWGIYPYESHCSFEFRHGSSMQDVPWSLEWGGKHRRHVKLSSSEDIQEKNLAYYVEQAQ